MSTARFDPAAYKRTTADQWQTAAEPWHRWAAVAEVALRRGFDAVWWTGPPIAAATDVFEVASAYDRAWERCIHGRPAVSLCLYIVGGLSEAEREEAWSEIERELSQYETAGGFEGPCELLVAAGTAPT